MKNINLLGYTPIELDTNIRLIPRHRGGSDIEIDLELLAKQKAHNDYYRQKAEENDVTWNPWTWAKEAYYRWNATPGLGGEFEDGRHTVLAVVPDLPIGPGGTFKGLTKANNVLEALANVKKLKAAKAAKDAVKTSKAVTSSVVLPKSLETSKLSRSSISNINNIINKLPEAERGPIRLYILNNKNFWKEYGSGDFNVTPSRAAGIVNAGRRSLGYTGSTYKGTVTYTKNQMSGYKARLVEDATRVTTGTKRTTAKKPR